MRRPFDRFGKNLGREALERSGRTVVQFEISRDAQYADLWHAPDPARVAERARLGLLGRIASVLCLIELYAHAPSAEELRACLSKHLAHWQACINRARAAKKRRQVDPPAPIPEAVQEPFLWVIAATVGAPLLKKLRAEPMPAWPPGVYAFGGDFLRMGIVVASELPRERDTLLVRIMAAGQGLSRAVAELSELPLEADERILAEDGLVQLHRVLEKVSSRTPEEEEFVVRMLSPWEKAAKEGHEKGRLQGRQEGRQEGEARALLTVLRGRGMAVPNATRARILAEQDPARLERWIKRALLATSIAEVLGEPN